MNFSRLPQISSCRLPLDQSRLSHAKAISSLWHEFSSSNFHCFLVFTFLFFHLENIFYYFHSINKVENPLDSPASSQSISHFLRLKAFLSFSVYLGLIQQTQAGLSDDSCHHRLLQVFRLCLSSRSSAQTYFRWPASLPTRWTQFFLSDRRVVWFFKITKFAPFESVERPCKGPLLALFFLFFHQ